MGKSYPLDIFKLEKLYLSQWHFLQEGGWNLKAKQFFV